MPFTADTQFEFNFLADTAGNQGQPLLISDHGRFVWCDDPFVFRFSGGILKVSSDRGPLVSGEGGTTLREVYQHVSRRFFPTAGRIPDATLFDHPQYNTWIELTYNQNQKDVLHYARAAIANGFPAGVLMIDEGWAKTYGDWDFDRGRFPDPNAMVKELHSLGFKVMLWVCPYITPAGPFYKDLWLDHTREGRTIWIQNANNPSQPAIMEWWDGFSAVVDLTNPDGIRWFRAQLDRLVSGYGVDGFKFDGGDAGYYAPKAMLVPPKPFKNEATPNEQCEAFVRLGLAYPMNEFRACWKMAGQPIAQRLRDKNHSWEDLRKLVPGILNQGLMGYAFTCPDLIGGGEYLSFLNLAQVDQELIVRGAQCHALMPMMQFSVAPWRVLSPENMALCRQTAQLHAQMGGEILALAREAARTGEPMVRALEYEYPGLGYAAITDQFLLGPDILVAPVVHKGATRRPIQFPPGTWKGDDDSVVTGPCLKEVDAPLARLPRYRRLQTRP
jgi:alpha-glucosidase (family GH31 glycosyl hydrolase)